MRRLLSASLAFALAAMLLPLSVAAAEPRDYSYLFLQGKLTRTGNGRPVVDATVRVRSEAAVFEATSDRRGVFMFEKLPVDDYELEITTADGKTIRTAKSTGLDELERNRLEINLGTGKASALQIEASPAEFTVTAPDPPPAIGRFWKQFLIFLGAAALLAL
jgi:hypothetical protein